MKLELQNSILVLTGWNGMERNGKHRMELNTEFNGIVSTEWNNYIHRKEWYWK